MYFFKRSFLYCIFLFSVVFLLSGCTSNNVVDLNILATTDLHGVIPDDMISYIQNEKNENKNTIVVDAGDFLGSEFGTSGDMLKYLENRNEKDLEIPLAMEMKNAGFDTVTLGNHEFVENTKITLDKIISDFEKQGINVLSANTYNNDGSNYTKPYHIKEVKTNEGTIKIGILGLTIKEVGHPTMWDGEKLVKTKSLELKDQKGYEGQLYMNDLVEDAKKWVKIIKEKEKADLIVAVAHTGEKAKKPKNPGNRIQDLAQNVSGIDVIVAGHNHVQIKQHDYKNIDGDTVIVTEPGKHGECISKINIKLKKENNKWNVVDKSSDIVKFENSNNNLNMLSENDGKFYVETSSLLEKGKENEVISLKDVIPFKWDKMYIFKPNTKRDEIYEIAGYKFLNISESEDMYQFIIMNEGKVVCYSGIKKMVVPTTIKVDDNYFGDSNFINITPGKNDFFKVLRGEKVEYAKFYRTILDYSQPK